VIKDLLQVIVPSYVETLLLEKVGNKVWLLDQMLMH